MAENIDNQEELRQKYMEIQMISQQMQQMQQQSQLLEEQSMELNVTVQGLMELEKTKENQEILVPVATGIFSKAKLGKADEVIVNVGSNVMVEKALADAIEMTQERLATIDKYKVDTMAQINQLGEMAKRLDKELMQLSGLNK